jgi:hypothetical protein
MSPPNTITPLQNSVVPGPTVYMGYNTSVSNDINTGIKTILPINIKNVLTVQGGLNINSSTDGINSSSNLTIDSSGNLITQGSLTAAGSITSYGTMYIKTLDVNSNFTVSETGLTTLNDDLIIGSNFKITESTGAATTTFTGYQAPNSSTNTTATTTDPSLFTSTTSQHLVTQTYVDQQIWNQTARINTILGTDSSVVDSFNHVYQLITALEGSTTATAIGGLVDQTNEINTTVSDLAGDAVDPILINCSPAVWDEQCAPLPIPPTISSSSLDGWYFRNMVAGSGNTTNQITWNLPTNSVMTMTDFTNLYANIFAVSAESLPNIVIYTKAKNNGTDIDQNTNAKVTYSFSATSPNQYYCLYTGTTAPKNNFTASPIQCVSCVTANGQHTTTNSKNYDANIVSTTDQIAYFSIQTSDTVLRNTVEFVLNSFNIQQNSAAGTKGTTRMIFQNSSAASNYVFNTFFRKNIDFSVISSKNVAYTGAYNALFTVN